MPATATTPNAASAFSSLRERFQSGLLAAYPELIERMAWSREQIAAHQRMRLRELLTHAAEYSPFHARRLAGIDLAAVDPGDLSALPVMTKTQMMNELDDVYTDRRLHQCLVEDAIMATGDEPVPILDEYVAFGSGGSSGQRGVFVYDHDAAVQHIGSLSRGLVARIGQGGGPPGGGLPVALVAAASPIHQTGAAPALVAGGRLPFLFLPVPVTRPLPEIVEQLNTIQPPMLFSYPTVAAQLAAEQRAGRLHIAPLSITCTSETCTPQLRAAIIKGFGAPLIDTFGSTEGLVGVSPPNVEALVFAEDGCIVELVDHDNRPVPAGTPSAKVLITNLYNNVQPLIRYELTDSFLAQPAAGHDYLCARVQGRADEVFRYEWVAVHPLVIRSVLLEVPDVLDYQVHQTRHGIDMTVVAEPMLDTDRLRDRLVTALAQAGLADPDVQIRTVPGLPRHPETGKLRRFIPLS